MGKKDIIFLMMLLLVLVAAFVVTISYPSRARFFPLIVISLCGVLVLAELLKTFAVSFTSGTAERDSQEDEAFKTNKQKQLRFVLTIAWIGGFALSLFLFGFVIGLPLFVLAYVKMHEAGWRWAIILPIIMFLIVYGGFELVLKRPLYEGLLFIR
ncbi:tripartite tricarboxylate transporter TctB family protein [Thermodesulfobacteriota bacterium]